MLDFLKHIDRELFYFINVKLSNPFLDTIMPWCREKSNWIPLYILLSLWMVYLFRKEVWKIFLTVVILIVATDQVSSSIIKPMFHRLRPCRNPELSELIHKLVDCGGGFSFVSSHAANHFGLALFVTMLLPKNYKWLTPVLFLWASIVVFAQIYVGLHYPSDIIIGGLIGIIFGWLTGKMVNKWIVTPKPMNT